MKKVDMNFANFDRDCWRPTKSEVAANLEAGAAWTRQRDLPDVAGWADLRAAPDLVHERLTSRLWEQRCPSVVKTCPLPKPGKKETRKMSWFNPYDELHFRIITGRVATPIDAALGADVYSYRLANEEPGWSVANTREAFNMQRKRGRELLADVRCNALAISDIRHYYPSIVPEVLIGALERTNVSRGDVQLISDFLQGLTKVSELRGLPVGPEASGLLGNIVLLAVDEALTDCTLGHVRYMDDSWIFLSSENDWPEVYDIYSSAASTLGLEANTAKVAVYQKDSGNAQNALEHEQIAYLISDAGNYRASVMAAEDISEQLDLEKPDWQLIGFLFGSLRHNNSIDGLPVLYENPNILHEIPRVVGEYLLSIAANKQSYSKIDQDWLISQAISPNSVRSIAGQVRACQVASRLRLNKDHGKQLEHLALNNIDRGFAPLQAWAATAWGSSKSHKPEQAVAHACDSGDFSLRRAFALTLDSSTSTPFKRSCWRRKLISVDPDLAPTVAPLI